MAEPVQSTAFDATRATIVLQSGRAINLDPQVQTPATLEQMQRPLMLQNIPETFRESMKKDGKGLGKREGIAWEVFQDRIAQGESEAQALSTTRKLFGLEPMDAQTMAALEGTGALVTRPNAPELMSPITAEEAKTPAAQAGKPQMLPSGPRISSMEMLDVVLIQNGKTLDALMAKQEALGNHQKEEIQYELDNGGFFSLAADGTLTLFHKDGQTQNLTRFSPLNINTLGEAEPQKNMSTATPQQEKEPSTGQYVPPPPVKVAPSDLPPGSMIGASQPGGFSAVNGFNPTTAETPENAQETRHIPLLKKHGFENLEAFKKALFEGMDPKEKVKYTEKNVIDAVGFYDQHMERSQNNPSKPSPDALRKESLGFARTFARYSEEIPANSPPGTHQFIEPFPSQPNMQNMPATPNGQAPDGGAMDESRNRMQDALGPSGQRLTPEQMRQYTPGRPQEGASTNTPDPMIEVLAKNDIQPGMTFSEIAASTMFQSQYSPVGNPRENPQKGRGVS
jgi:hypothetical protein